ncbi:MAG: hypothetical protein R3B13_02450 [Polyangiaceae bacterium]
MRFATTLSLVAAPVLLAVACTNDFDAFAFDPDAGKGSGSGGAASGGAASGGSGNADAASSGGANTSGSVSCEGNNDCDLGNSFCCYRLSGPSCQSNNQSCSPGTDIFCDGPEDCSGGEVCCANLGNGSFVRRMECVQPNDCRGGDNRVVCGDAAQSCPDQTTCSAVSNLPYRFCQP